MTEERVATETQMCFKYMSEKQVFTMANKFLNLITINNVSPGVQLLMKSVPETQLSLNLQDL
jgi:hypothetical protein